jgi:hypothetical protein
MHTPNVDGLAKALGYTGQAMSQLKPVLKDRSVSNDLNSTLHQVEGLLGEALEKLSYVMRKV